MPILPNSNHIEDQSRRKRVLLIAYLFPPVGGAGVQRVTKFVKYLPRMGWDVSVLTVANPSVPLLDESLTKDIPADTIIRRSKTWEPDYTLKSSISAGRSGDANARNRVKRFVANALRKCATLVLQPDPQILWVPRAVAEGRRLLREIRHDVILVSGPPFSSFLIGESLSRRSGLPLVLDYRDEWTISNDYFENKQIDPLSRFLHGKMQERVLRAAKGIIATTRNSADSVGSLCRKAKGTAIVTWIYNGFDPDDFLPLPPSPSSQSNRIRVVYVGTLWNLTSVEPFVEALKRIANLTPDLAEKLEIVFVGRRTGQQAELVEQLRSLPVQLVLHDYLNHSSAIEVMRNCDVLLLLLSDLAGAERVVPAKLFEYMATGRQILTIAPVGEVHRLLDGYPGGRFEPRDIDGIVTWLTVAVRQHESSVSPQASNWDMTPFTRSDQSRQLADFLNRVICHLPASNKSVDIQSS
jgi:glycosyltransferase involved in cell wall biosynthesis